MSRNKKKTRIRIDYILAKLYTRNELEKLASEKVNIEGLEVHVINKIATAALKIKKQSTIEKSLIDVERIH